MRSTKQSPRVGEVFLANTNPQASKTGNQPSNFEMTERDWSLAKSGKLPDDERRHLNRRSRPRPPLTSTHVQRCRYLMHGERVGSGGREACGTFEQRVYKMDFRRFSEQSLPCSWLARAYELWSNAQQEHNKSMAKHQCPTCSSERALTAIVLKEAIVLKRCFRSWKTSFSKLWEEESNNRVA